MVVFSLFYTPEASLTHIMIVFALKIVKNAYLNMIFWGVRFFFSWPHGPTYLPTPPLAPLYK
jgi:hypothetical protein